MSGCDALQLLGLAYHGSKQERTRATAELESAMQSVEAGHHLVALLRAGVDPAIPVEQSLSALLYVKNSLMHIIPDQVLSETPGLLAEVQQILLSGVFQVPEGHRKVICACIMTLISGFQWNYLPLLMPMVVADLTNRSAEQSLAVLELLATYVKRFKTVNLEPLAMKLEVCGALVPVLPSYLAYGDFRITHQVFKVMECVVETALQVDNARDIPSDALDTWFELMAVFPEKHYDAASHGGIKAYEMYVRCVKRVAMITFSVINDATRRRKAAPVATRFLQQYASHFLAVWRSWLSLCIRAGDRESHKKSELFAIRYIKLCTLDEKLYRDHLRPAAMDMIEHLFFPYLCYGEDDEEVFADESSLSEYVRYMMDEGADNGELSQRQAASNAILAMIGGKKKFHDGNVLQELLQVLTTGLSVETNADNFPRLFGFLHLLSIIRKYLRAVDTIWQGQMAQVLVTFVAPRVLPTVPFIPLRCKAIIVCQRYSKVPMPTEEDFAAFVQMMCSLVQDADSRVRLAAIDAMCTLLEMKRARPYMLPALVPLVEECIAFLSRVQTTFVPTVILHLATHFAPELTPVMGKLGHTLVQHFLASAFDLEQQEVNPIDESALGEYENAAFSADALLEAVYTVVTSCSDNAEAFLSMRGDVVRLVRRVLEQPDCFDFMEKTLGIFLHVVNFSKPIPPECWELLPLLFHSVDSGIGVDFFNTIEEVLDNFISGATAEYLSNPMLMDATYAMCQKMLVGGVVCTPECQMAPAQLIEAMLHQAKGNAQGGLFDLNLPRFEVLLLQALNTPDIQAADVRVRLWIIAALMDCVYYNAEAALGIMMQSNAYPIFFDGFFYFFRACVDVNAGCSASGKAAKKSNKSSREAAEVAEALSILTRKVVLLGLTALLNYLVSPAGSTYPHHAAFVQQYLTPTLTLANYCLFTNERLYTARCKIAEANLMKIQQGIEEDVDDVDADDTGVLGEDGADDTGEAYEDLSEADEWGDADEGIGLTLDEGDEYESPIDAVNEVTYFLQWVDQLPHQPDGVRQMTLAVLRPQADYVAAAQAAGRYRELCTQLEVAMQADFKARSGDACGGLPAA